MLTNVLCTEQKISRRQIFALLQRAYNIKDGPDSQVRIYTRGQNPGPIEVNGSLALTSIGSGFHPKRGKDKTVGVKELMITWLLSLVKHLF